MALEATLQMAEIKGIQKSSIHSFSCQDIHLEAALIVPEAHSGVEVLFNLRRSRLNHTTYYGSLYEFTVTSVTKSSNEDVFSDHAHGLVGLELRADGNKTVSSEIVEVQLIRYPSPSRRSRYLQESKPWKAYVCLPMVQYLYARWPPLRSHIPRNVPCENLRGGNSG